jgi:hypothetical protein
LSPLGKGHHRATALTEADGGFADGDSAGIPPKPSSTR